MVTHTLDLDFQHPQPLKIAYTKQNDRDSRTLCLRLYNAGAPYLVDSGVVAVFRARKPDGCICFYDSDQEDAPAVTIQENQVQVLLVEQVLTLPGTVLCELNLYSQQGERLTTFSFELLVEQSGVTDGEIVSSDYYNVLTQIVSQGQQLVQQAQQAAENALESAQLAVQEGEKVQDLVGQGTGQIQQTQELVQEVEQYHSQVQNLVQQAQESQEEIASLVAQAGEIQTDLTQQVQQVTQDCQSAQQAASQAQTQAQAAAKSAQSAQESQGAVADLVAQAQGVQADVTQQAQQVAEDCQAAQQAATQAQTQAQGAAQSAQSAQESQGTTANLVAQAQEIQTDLTQQAQQVAQDREAAQQAATQAQSSAQQAQSQAQSAAQSAQQASESAQQATNAAQGVEQGLGQKMDKVSGATQGNIGILASDGSLTDSGIAATGLATVDSSGKLNPMPSAADVGAVPITRTVNGKSLSGDVTLSAADVGAVPDQEVEWIYPSLLTGYSTLTNQPPFQIRYAKFGNVVVVTGIFTQWVSGDNAFVLPEGYRTKGHQRICGLTTNSNSPTLYNIGVNSSGAVFVSNPTGSGSGQLAIHGAFLV